MILKKVYEHDSLYQRELAELTFKDTPTLTKIIDLLDKKALLNRVPDEHDRRRFSIVLTPEGMNKVEEMLPYVDKIRQKAWENLTHDDFEHFKRVLVTIYNNLSI